MVDWTERNRGHIVVLLINLAVTGALFFWLQRPVATPLEITPPQPTPAPVTTPNAQPLPGSTQPLFGTATAALLRVYVTGAVAHPDVYRLPPGSIVKDAIQAAGGASGEADLARVNLAQELRDQQQVIVPRVGEPDVAPPAGSTLPGRSGEIPLSAKVNINTATADELDTLPGVGATTARRILDYRAAHGPFKSIEDIQQVTGIGDATYQKLKDLITVGN
jgi:competence protein ComEA